MQLLEAQTEILMVVMENRSVKALRPAHVVGVQQGVEMRGYRPCDDVRGLMALRTNRYSCASGCSGGKEGREHGSCVIDVPLPR